MGLGKLYDGCRKHDSEFQYSEPPPPCPHCAEDAKILEERIGRVTTAVADLCFAVRAEDMGSQDNAQTDLRAALRDLVREVRR